MAAALLIGARVADGLAEASEAHYRISPCYAQETRTLGFQCEPGESVRSGPGGRSQREPVVATSTAEAKRRLPSALRVIFLEIAPSMVLSGRPERVQQVDDRPGERRRAVRFEDDAEIFLGFGHQDCTFGIPRCWPRAPFSIRSSWRRVRRFHSPPRGV